MNILQIVTVSAKKKTLQIYALNEDRFVSRKDINVPDQVVAMVSELYSTCHYVYYYLYQCLKYTLVCTVCLKVYVICRDN